MNNENYFNLIDNIQVNDAKNFDDFVKLHEQQEALIIAKIDKADTLKQSQLKNKDFISLIPKTLLSYVLYVVESEFKSDVSAYRASVPLFEKLFKEKDCLLANKLIDKKKVDSHRKHTSQRKALLLWASQLLKLVGARRGGALPLALVNEYKASIEAQESFIAGHRLIGINGKSYKLSKNKRQQRNAQNYRISKTMEKLAKDSKFTFSFVTLTLPPEYHPNPKFGKCSYSGKTPEQAKEKLNQFWKLIRANLAKNGFKVGVDFFGIQVNEAHKDSTLHKHLLIYHSKKKSIIKKIHRIIKDVQNREKIEIAKKQGIPLKDVRFKFDIKLNNGKAKASSYLFKYISKSLDNKETLEIEACRSFYSARAFNYFGLDGKINAFNHLCSNHKNYDKVLSQALIDVFSTRNLYEFIKFHKDKFQAVYKYDVFLGVAYEENGNLTLIEKRQYCLFECPNYKEVALNEVNNAISYSVSNARFSYSTLQNKAKLYNLYINEYLTDKADIGFNVILKNGFSMDKNFHSMRDNELNKFKEEFDKDFKNSFSTEYIKDFSYKDSFLELVTVIQHYSSKNELTSFLNSPEYSLIAKKQEKTCLIE